MIKLHQRTKEFLAQYFPYVTVKQNKVLIKGVRDIEIPSSHYPLFIKKNIQLFSFMDTKRIEDIRAEKAYNDVHCKLGFCYSNTEELVKSFTRYGLTDVVPYSGWLLLDGDVIHHAWLVYKGRYVVDPSVTRVDEIVRERKYMTPDLMRQDIVKLTKEYEQYPNTFHRTFGQVAPFVLYIGSPTVPQKGRVIYNELMDKYPQHPAYTHGGMNQNGLSKTQAMYYKK